MSHGSFDNQSIQLLAAILKTLRGGSDYTSTSGMLADLILQNDLSTTLEYFDAGTDDERVKTVTYHSNTTGNTIILTMTYGGSSGAYYLTNVQSSS